MGRFAVEEVSPRWVGLATVGSRQNERASRRGVEVAQHPEGRQFGAGIGVGGWDVGGVGLVERPVGVPTAALVAGIVDQIIFESFV